MNKFILLSLFLYGCGYSAKYSILVGQVKKVMHYTPLICPDFMSADISLGVIRGGVGSVSTQDVWMYVSDQDHFKLLSQAAESGKLVKLKYDQKRVSLCVPERWLTSVEILNN